MKVLAAILALCIALAVAAAGCGGGDSSSSGSTESSSSESNSTAKTKPKVTVPEGAPPKKLVIKDIEEGSGAEAKVDDELTLHYVGVGYKSKKEIASSWSRNKPYVLALGAGQFIDGWDQGLEGMKVGGRRELIIPPYLAFGPNGSSPTIGNSETLIYVIDLLAIK